jgi:hypothetical protein
MCVRTKPKGSQHSLQDVFFFLEKQANKMGVMTWSYTSDVGMMHAPRGSLLPGSCKAMQLCKWQVCGRRTGDNPGERGLAERLVVRGPESAHGIASKRSNQHALSLPWRERDQTASMSLPWRGLSLGVKQNSGLRGDI